jgi:hypothetical protein
VGRSGQFVVEMMHGFLPLPASAPGLWARGAFASRPDDREQRSPRLHTRPKPALGL